MEPATGIIKSSIADGGGHSAPTAAPEAQLAAGKALRGKIPREQHARWNLMKRRRDTIDLLRQADIGRVKKLIPIRYGRMLPSPLTFYRGAAGIMAADLARRTPTTGLKVQACGDCHLVNFGGFATPERSIIFDINDFDETAPAPWEWDLKRLVASIVLAARSNGFSDHRGFDCAVNCARRYREHMREFARIDPLAVWYTTIKASDLIERSPKNLQRSVRKQIEKAANWSNSEFAWPKLAGSLAGEFRITDQPPLIFHPRTTGAEDGAAFKQLFQTYRQSLLEHRRTLLDRYQVVDVAIKVVGVGSVGRRCWIALMMSRGGHPLFLQFKEAVNSVLEPYVGKSIYGHHGQRVVMGQHLMQPASDIFLGWATASDGRHFYVRQLHDARIKPAVQTFNAKTLDAYAQACGWVLARAHAKTSEISATISGYLGPSSDAFDTAMGKFALAYADQAERDHAALKAAVRRGEIAVIKDT